MHKNTNVLKKKKNAKLMEIENNLTALIRACERSFGGTCEAAFRFLASSPPTKPTPS